MAELPTGTVTFLFTDIEGSTQLLHSLGRARFAEVMEAHSRALRQAIEEERGDVVDTQGDAFFAVFRTSLDAVAAAVAAQQGLDAYQWPEGSALRVRMGIHTGEAQLSGERYVGLSVHRASRIGAAAHGGQVLLSNTTRELVEDDLPDGVALRDLGVHRLKDLERPEHLSQLVIRGLQHVFPPPRTVADETPFEVGRRRFRRPRVLATGAAAAAVTVAAATVFLVTGRRGESSAFTVSPNSVAAIDARTGKVVADLQVGTRPGPVAAGDGAVWIGNLDDETVTHVNASTLKVAGTVSLGRTPTGLAVSGGRVWAVTGDPGAVRGRVFRIDPQYDRVTGTASLAANYLFGTYIGGARAIAADGRQVWVAGSDATAQRIDPTAMRMVKKVVVADSNLPGIAIGFGSTWVVSDASPEVTRISRTGAVLSTIPFGDEPSAIAAGAGAVWVADRWDDRVARIDPAKGDLETQIPVGEHPTGVAVGVGRVWVANSRAGTISEIDPTRNAVVRTITLSGGSPRSVAVANGLVWVTIAATSRATIAPKTRNVARLDLSALDISLDPVSQQAYNWQPWQVLQATCLKLVNLPDRTPSPGSPLVPDAARLMPTVTNGGKTYTFVIRPNLRFSPPSNVAVTASTFKYSIERALDPRTNGAARDTGYLDDIVGAKAFERGKSKGVAGIAVHRQVLTIELTKPVGDLTARLAIPFFCAVPVGTPIDASGLSDIPSAGPYYVASHIPGEQIILRRNPNYPGPRPHRLAEIDIELDVGPARNLSNVESGKADYNFGALASPAADPARLRKLYGPGSPAARKGDQRWFEEPELGVRSMPLNTRRPLFASKRMRQAISFAVDRQALAAVTPRTQRATSGYLPPGMPGYRSEGPYPLRPDLHKARLLAGSEHPRTAVVWGGEEGRDRAELVRQALAALGITAHIDIFPGTEFGRRISARQPTFDIAVNGGWDTDYVDPNGMLSLLFDARLSSHGFNPGAFDDPAVNSRFDALAKLTGRARYGPFGRFAFHLARDDAPEIVWGVPRVTELFSTRIGCRVYQPINQGVDLAALCIK